MYLELIRHFGTYSNHIQLKTKPKKKKKPIEDSLQYMLLKISRLELIGRALVRSFIHSLFFLKLILLHILLFSSIHNQYSSLYCVIMTASRLKEGEKKSRD